MKTKVFLISFLLISTITLNAQNFKPGYVILNNNDTLMGEIQYHGISLMTEYCRFKKFKDASAIKYSPSEIKGYRFIDGRYFVTKKIDNQPILLEMLVEGKINVYKKINMGKDDFYIEKEGKELTILPYKIIHTREESRDYYHSSKTHIRKLEQYLQDAEQFIPRIQKMEKPNQKELINLAIDYHNAVCKDEECKVYKKAKRSIVAFAEPFIGIQSNKEQTLDLYTSNFGSGGAYSIQDKGNFLYNGVIFHLNFPNFNDKIFIRTGITHSNKKFTYKILQQTQYSTSTENGEISIPFHIEYIAPIGKIRPRFSYGLNIPLKTGENFGTSTSVTTGVIIIAGKNLRLSITGELTFISKSFILPGKTQAYSAYFGVFFKL